MSAAAPPRPLLWSSLLVCVAAISTAAPLIVKAGAPAPVTSLWRMGGAGVVLLLWNLVREPGSLARVARGDLARLFLSGNLLALHYLFWIGSLSLTSVVSSTVLVTTNPLWVGLGAWLFLREPPARATWIAIVVGIAGAILLGLADAKNSAPGATDSLLGDAMALAGSLAGSATILYGRSLRSRVSTTVYQSTLCLSAVPLVLGVVLVTHAPLSPVSSNQALLLAAVVFVPQLIGNTILSWLLGHFSAPQVALVILGEPIGASLIAWIALHQPPQLLALPGAALVLIAVALGVREHR